MDCIKRKLIKRCHMRLVKARKWTGPIPLKFCKKLAERQNERRYVTILCLTGTLFEVKDRTKYYIVNLETHCYDCGLWEVSEIPFKHAMTVITTKRLNYRDYVHKYLTK
ncbi:hypothetical protein ACOSQ3_002208 [Xanthoceras sorbifolium]